MRRKNENYDTMLIYEINKFYIDVTRIAINNKEAFSGSPQRFCICNSWVLSEGSRRDHNKVE